MKRIILALCILTPAIASAQIYPLEVYATVGRAGTDQKIKFMHSDARGDYVGICKKQADGEYLCDLAKDGTYKTDNGLTVRAKNMGQLFAENGRDRCTYKTSTQKLDCD